MPRPTPWKVEANGDRPRYFVLVYDSSALRVVSLSGHGHDFTGAVLTLTGRVQEHRRRPEVVVRLLSAADLPDLLARHAELFEGLAFPTPEPVSGWPGRRWRPGRRRQRGEASEHRMRTAAVHTQLLAGDYSPQLGLALGFLGLAVASLALGLPSTMDGA